MFRVYPMDLAKSTWNKLRIEIINGVKWLRSERNGEIGIRPNGIEHSETTNMIIEYDSNSN